MLYLCKIFPVTANLMNPKLPLSAALFAAVFSIFTASAQPGWQWAHCWCGGNGISVGDYYNYINTTAFDEDGNLYVYGSMGGTARLDGELLHFSEDSRVLITNNPSILLAKFDTLGNMLWYKVVKQSTEEAVPCWMEIRDDRIYIAGNCGINGDSHHEWLYYMDTLIEESQITSLPDSLQKPPFKKYCYWTFFAILDLDGNLLEDRFVETFSREYYEPHIRMYSGICKAGRNIPAPIHVDRDGNWYIFTPLSYRGIESYPYTVVVYGDTDRVYDLYLPGNIAPETPPAIGFFNAMLYKFSPDWELLTAKLLVDHTEGMTSIWPNGGDSIKCHVCYYKGLSFDEEDNMYLSGYMQMSPCYAYAGGLLHHYPIYLYWDSIHRLVVHDITSAGYANFIVKYDTAGSVVWCNQLHSKGYVIDEQTNLLSTQNTWHGNTFHDNSVYVIGQGYYYIDDSTEVYFDNESNPLQRYTEYTYMELHTEMTNTTEIGFFARYDKNTGAYISHGIVPAIKASLAGKPGVVNNRVFAFAKYGIYNEQTNLFVEWQNDGTFIKADSVVGKANTSGTVANDRGYVATALLSLGPMQFSNSLMTDCHNGSNATAVVAMYHDPEFAEPYVGVPDRDDQLLPVKIWPNPTIHTLQVESTESLLECVSVLDLAGRTLLRQNVQDYRCQIDVSSLLSGMYLLEIICDGKKQYEKFVKTTK